MPRALPVWKPQPSPAASRSAAPPWAAGGGGSGDRCMGACAENVRGSDQFTASAGPGSSHGSGEPSPSNALTTTTAPGLTRAPAAPWHGRGGGAGDRCSSPSPHGLLRPLLPGPSGARARLSRQQQSLVRAPRHGPHRPPRPAGAEAPPDAPAHRPLARPQGAVQAAQVGTVSVL